MAYIDHLFPSKEIDFLCCCRYSGFYKGVQSAGGAVAWQIDSHNVSFLTQLIVNWALTTVSYPLLALLVMLAVKDNNKPEEGPPKDGALPSLDEAPGGVTKPN